MTSDDDLVLKLPPPSTGAAPAAERVEPCGWEERLYRHYPTGFVMWERVLSYGAALPSGVPRFFTKVSLTAEGVTGTKDNIELPFGTAAEALAFLPDAVLAAQEEIKAHAHGVAVKRQLEVSAAMGREAMIRAQQQAHQRRNGRS